MRPVNPLTSGLVAVFAVLALATTVLFMPAAELLPAQVAPGSLEPGFSPLRSESIMEFYENAIQRVTKVFYSTGDLTVVVNNQDAQKLPGVDKSYILYSVFFALAMVFAAIAINAIGRLDSEEKTIVPVKK